MNGKRIKPETKDRIHSLSRAKWSITEIAKELGLTADAVSRHVPPSHRVRNKANRRD